GRYEPRRHAAAASGPPRGGDRRCRAVVGAPAASRRAFPAAPRRRQSRAPTSNLARPVRNQPPPADDRGVMTRVDAFPPSDDHPLVDVGIPAYGRSRFVEDAIESVLAQTLGSFRLTVSEDGPGGGALEDAV